MGAKADWRRQALVFGLVIVGVVLALTSVNAEAELQRRRIASCDSSLALPTSAYVLGAIGLLVGALALTLLIRWFGRSRQVIAVVLYVTAVAGVVFELFALLTTLQSPGPPCPIR